MYPPRPAHWLVKALRDARIAAGLARYDVSKVCGRANSWWGQVERGDREPSLADLERAADALGYELELIKK